MLMQCFKHPKLRGALFAMIMVVVFNFVADFRIATKVKWIKNTLQDFEVKLWLAELNSTRLLGVKTLIHSFFLFAFTLHGIRIKISV